MEPPQVRPRRVRPVRGNAAACRLTDEELACIDRGAAAAGLKRGPYLRGLALYRAGWHGYSGPLFTSGTDARDVERKGTGDVLHETLRTLREHATTCAAIYNQLGERPSQDGIKLLVALAHLVTTFQAGLVELRAFPDAPQLEFDLLALAERLRPKHGIAAEQLYQTATLLGAALRTKGNDSGKAESQEA